MSGALLKDFEREYDNAQRWAGDLEWIMQSLGVRCERVNDARETIMSRLQNLAGELLVSADLDPMIPQAAVMRRVAAILSKQV